MRLYLVLCAVFCKKPNISLNDSADHAIVCGNGNSAPCGKIPRWALWPLQDKNIQIRAAFDSEELQLLDQSWTENSGHNIIRFRPDQKLCE